MDAITVVKIQLPSMRTVDTAARKEASRLWNRMVKLHRWFRKRQLPWPSESMFEKHFKGRFALHSQTVQALIQKFFSNIETARTNRKHGNKTARYPHRLKPYFPVMWKASAIKHDGHSIFLSMGKGRDPLKFRLPRIPARKVIAAELGYRELRLTLKKEIPDVEKPSGMAAADLGIIHLAMVTDGQESICVVGRGLRSIIQGHNKKKSALSARLSRCKRGSRRWKKLKRSMRVSARHRDNAQRNLLHHAANTVKDFCQKQDIGTLAVGDIREINRNKRKKSSKRLNQENGNNPLGQFVKYLRYKLERVGCKVVLVNEAYTTKTCPVCGHKHKPAGRTYRCHSCGNVFARDEVGAVNILNRHLNGEIVPGTLLPTNKIKYLRPVKFRSAVVPLTPGKWLGQVHDASDTTMGEAVNAALVAS
jgi:putative transposase